MGGGGVVHIRCMKSKSLQNSSVTTDLFRRSACELLALLSWTRGRLQNFCSARFVLNSWIKLVKFCRVNTLSVDINYANTNKDRHVIFLPHHFRPTKTAWLPKSTLALKRQTS